MNCSMPDLPVPHHLLKFAWVHIYCTDDAIQPFHPLTPSSPPTLNLSQHQDFSNELAVHIRWPTYWSFSFNISPSNQYLGLFSLKINWFDILAVQETYRSLQHHSSKPSTVTYNKSITCNKLNISPFRSTRPIKWSNV